MRGAGDGIRTHELLRDKVLNLTPLTRLGDSRSAGARRPRISFFMVKIGRLRRRRRLIVYREIYCRDCKRIIGRYNAKYYTEARVGEVIKMCHAGHIKLGHNVEQRRVVTPAQGSG